MSDNYGREAAWKLLGEHIKSESLLRHALAVEAVMRHFTRVLDIHEEEKWGVVGLLHDIDFEEFPDQHCSKARDILEGSGWPEEYIRAVQSHGYRLVNDIAPVHVMEKVLYTTDELTGLITATAVLRPSKSLFDLEVKSVKKKWKQKGFAVGVNREVIEEGAGMLGMDIEYIIEQTITGMRAVADELGLRGDVPA